MSIRPSLDRFGRTEIASRLAFGDGVELLHPGSAEEMAGALAEATKQKQSVLVWGGGTHQGMGYRVEPDVVIFTDRLNRLIDWEPDDLTVVVEAGTSVADLEAELGTRNQTAGLLETAGAATVGGVLASGVSGYRRARYGPTRDRVLEVQVVTGDGRVVRGGGRVVKNVTGYDLPRLVVGSLGSLGVIISCCFKLWPAPRAVATVTVDPKQAVGVHRPLAVLQTGQAKMVYLGGTEAEISDQLTRLGGESVDELIWPTLPETAWAFSLRLTPRHAAEIVEKLPAGMDYIHQIGIGEIAIASSSLDGMAELRSVAEAGGGALVVTRAADATFDPWGSPPATRDLQKQLVAAFDPARVINPGRLPGRI